MERRKGKGGHYNEGRTKSKEERRKLENMKGMKDQRRKGRTEGEEEDKGRRSRRIRQKGKEDFNRGMML